MGGVNDQAPDNGEHCHGCVREFPALPDTLHGGVMNDHERANYNKVAADAVVAALRLARSEMPEASDARLLLMILGNAAACCGRLRIEYPDVLRIVSGLYKEGSELPPLPAPCQGSASAVEVDVSALWQEQRAIIATRFATELGSTRRDECR